MSASLEAMLMYVGYFTIAVLSLLMILLIQKIWAGWIPSTQKIEIVKVPELKHKAELGAKDNTYTELAAGKHVTAAEKNLAAQHVALEVAKTQERTEDKRLERVRLEKQGSA